MPETMTLKSGITLDLSRRGRKALARCYVTQPRQAVIIGDFDYRGVRHTHICLPEFYEKWDGKPETIPGVGFPATNVDEIVK